MEERLLNIKEAAKYLNVHRETARRYLESGKLKGYKVGPRWRIKWQDLDDFISKGGK